MSTDYILRVQADDSVGIVAAITTFLAKRAVNIDESHDFADPETKRFFVWLRMSIPEEQNLTAFEAAFSGIADAHGLEWNLRRADEKPRTLVMASKPDHCLNDLLFRHRSGRLGVDIVGIVSNHLDAKWYADRHDLPFHHIPVTKDTKPQAEAALEELIGSSDCKLVVLARYMQVLSDTMSAKLSGRCINIHHSALPSFKGGRPYHQAYARGVKLIGATAHYVTADLDEGPIIAQETSPVDHRATPEKMIEMGRDIEARVLARAVRAHAEGRVFLSGSRTIVFD
ncbi:MAG: formyltetrahydrofolate deformylase [Parvularculaceae bacterium]|nr:formyltetrahydrofolate deformylase [Parvularculaceae bacterium]